MENGINFKVEVTILVTKVSLLLQFRAGRRYFQLVGLCILIVCEAHRHAKHANIRGSGGMPPGNF